MNTAVMTWRLRSWLGILLFMAAGSYALSQELAQTIAIDPPGRVARLGYIEGEVSMMSGDPSAGMSAGPAAPPPVLSEPPVLPEPSADGWMEAVLNRPLTSGDTLWVGSDGRAQLQTGSSDIYLDHDTGFGFILLDYDVMQMSLTEGAATIRVRRLAERETIQVETPHAGVVLRRPGEYHLVIAADDRTIVKTRSGEAQVDDGRRSYTLGSGQMGAFSGPDGPPGSLATLAPRDAFETWANERDQRGEQSRSARHVSSEVIGYEDLDEHGEWLDEPGYGAVWRPLHIASDWAPYRYGQWAWIAPWGWTWMDEARWGFAPFHYGRWAQIRNRWCWVPGPRYLRPVYAPALVGWSGGNSLSVVIGLRGGVGGGVGWFPLAPHEIYRPWYRHTPRHLRRVNHANTFIDRSRRGDLYTRRQPPHPYRYGHTPGALTAAPRTGFSAHPAGASRIAPRNGNATKRAQPPRLPQEHTRIGSASGGAPAIRHFGTSGARTPATIAVPRRATLSTIQAAARQQPISPPPHALPSHTPPSHASPPSHAASARSSPPRSPPPPSSSSRPQLHSPPSRHLDQDRGPRRPRS
ncbi:DUF6600 domain-containing protein [Steroidobacter denitrificans]|uniref:DUF6600 domain-containing protein n=1 Tax=Steroidobacter denitrificans TaxID=465721 RepID=UPI00082D5030|nr:DUF6600 domain-containing protein [Steroidobacter denitrificans]